MPSREIRIPFISTPDFNGGRLHTELAITARYNQDSGKLEPEADDGMCSLWHGHTERPIRIPLVCAVRLLGGLVLSGDHILSESIKAWLDGLVDDVLRDEQDDEARYGRQVSSF